VFEATFQAGGVLVRADLLLPARGGYRLTEVKSTASVKAQHLEDAAIQAWVARRAGLSITRVEIAHIDTSFVYPGGEDYEGLFAHADVLAEANGRAKEIPKWVKAARHTLDGDEPEIEPGPQCKDPHECPYIAYCSPRQDDAYPPEILPRGGALAAQLRAEGYADLRKVPKKRLTNPNHVRVWRVTKSGKAELNPAAREKLEALDYPRRYLDFETINFAVPVWKGTRPYSQVPFQWSCHVEQRNGKVEHRAFLADGSNDPRRAFAVSLVDALATHGPIIVYNATFERGRMQELAAAFPRLATALNAAIARIVDLLPIAREHYYHPEMRGSWSLKAVLPTVAPELAYDNLEVANGGMAQQAFAEILHPHTLPARRQKLREALLTYCERDTRAMVTIARFLATGRKPRALR